MQRIIGGSPDLRAWKVPRHIMLPIGVRRTIPRATRISRLAMSALIGAACAWYLMMVQQLVLCCLQARNLTIEV